MRVGVGFLHRADSLAPQFRKSLMMLAMRDARTKRQIVSEYDQESSANISAGRCDIVRRFLADKNQPEWLWMLDSDMTFGEGILERLLRSADPQARPIMGGLCFGIRPVKRNGVEQFNVELGGPVEAFPTLYKQSEGGFVPWWDYPRDTVCQPDSTGAACVLIHRQVLADRRWGLGPDGKPEGHPFPWFREAVLGGQPCSEDHFFFLKARRLGFPLHVDTGARTGHVKPRVIDEFFYLQGRG